MKMRNHKHIRVAQILQFLQAMHGLANNRLKTQTVPRFAKA
jgi:hypothetical protein